MFCINIFYRNNNYCYTIPGGGLHLLLILYGNNFFFVRMGISLPLLLCVAFLSSLTNAFLHLLASFLVTLCQVGVGYLQGNPFLSTDDQDTIMYLQFVDTSTVFPLFSDD